jgi:hypothetical protein
MIAAIVLIAGMAAVLIPIGLKANRPGRVVVAGAPPDGHAPLAVFFLPDGKGGADGRLVSKLSEKYPNWRVSRQHPYKDEQPPFTELRDESTSDYRAPTADELKANGRGLSEAEQAQVLKAKAATTMYATLPNPPGTTLRDIEEIALAVAEDGQGVVWDEHTLETYSVAEWKARRLGTWKEGIAAVAPRVGTQTTADGELRTRRSRGMQKFGLPELKMAGLSVAQNDAVDSLFYAVMQRLSEKPDLLTAAQPVLKLSELQQPDVREGNLKRCQPNAAREVKLKLTPVKDEKVPTVLLDFELPGTSVGERAEAAIAAVYGT